MRASLGKTIDLILDFIFPPSPETLAVRALSPFTIKDTLPRAPSPFHPFITSLFAYKNPLVGELISCIKHKKDRHALACAGYAMHEKLRTDCRAPKTFLIPIPLSKKRRKERGYNQSELLIEEIIALDTAHGSENRFEKRYDILVRTKHTSEQKLKSREERLHDMENIFKVEDVEVDKNIPIVIIDDVTTTGSTVNAARETLLRAGYTDVRALTLAH